MRGNVSHPSAAQSLTSVTGAVMRSVRSRLSHQFDCDRDSLMTMEPPFDIVDGVAIWQLTSTANYARHAATLPSNVTELGTRVAIDVIQRHRNTGTLRKVSSGKFTHQLLGRRVRAEARRRPMERHEVRAPEQAVRHQGIDGRLLGAAQHSRDVLLKSASREASIGCFQTSCWLKCCLLSMKSLSLQAAGLSNQILVWA
eukprot:COSAG01_NODE_5722_length_4075_cov_40.849598_4_plen_199_part_00